MHERAISDIDRGWAFGLFDTDGSISLARSRQTRIPYSLTLRLCNTCRAAIERFRSIVGVGTIRSRPPRGRRRECWVWWLGARDEISTILSEFAPFLSIRQYQASLAQQFLSTQDLKLMRKIFEELRRAKTKKGPRG